MSMTIDPKEVPVQVFHQFLLGAVTPRPIALVSTIDKAGAVNLSPFSFFNCFGVNPPVLVFSPSRRVRDNTTKHTFENVTEVPEVVVHIVNYAMVQQTSLASAEYDRGVNEFIKAGFTQVASTLVRPPRVGEAPVAMECKVVDIIRTGEGPGAGNLVICEVLLMHISPSVVGPDNRIDPVRLDAVARLGGDWYARVSKESIFRVSRPLDKPCIGLDGLPEELRTSPVLTGHELAQLANIEAVPAYEAKHPVFSERPELGSMASDEIHRYARELILAGRTDAAWQVLLGSIARRRQSL